MRAGLNAFFCLRLFFCCKGTDDHETGYPFLHEYPNVAILLLDLLMEFLHVLSESKCQKCEKDPQRNDDKRESRIKDRDHDKRGDHLYGHAGKARDYIGVIVCDKSRVVGKPVEPLA